MFFFFNDTATTEIYTLSLHDALPICSRGRPCPRARSTARAPRRSTRPRSARPEEGRRGGGARRTRRRRGALPGRCRSEEHTSELQSRQYLVCRLLLEKKKRIQTQISI